SLLKSKDLAALQTRELIESTLASVIRNYYNVALLEEKVEIAENTLQISHQRVERVKGRVAYGGSLSLELLNAKVDMQTDSINLLTVNLQLENARRDLNLILGRDVEAEIEVSSLVDFSPAEDVSYWLEQAEANSSVVQSSSSKLEQSLLNLKAARSGFYPSISGSLSYDLSRIDSDSGTLKKGESAGVTAGLNLSLDLFTGFRTVNNIRNARITVKSSGEKLQQTKLTLRKQLLNAYSTYRNALLTVEVEKQNLETLKLNFDRTAQLYQLGQVTTTQFRESQLNWISGQSRLINEKYTAKFAEIELYRLSGLLMDHLGLTAADR
ncbi:MAG: TolC family protein, partial [FCB group bacterium]|nr:TolC family protein [FCB group bacterium]